MIVTGGLVWLTSPHNNCGPVTSHCVLIVGVETNRVNYGHISYTKDLKIQALSNLCTLTSYEGCIVDGTCEIWLIVKESFELACIGLESIPAVKKQ